MNYLNMYGDIHCLYNLSNNNKKLPPKNGDPYFLMKNQNYVVCFKPRNLKRSENGFIKNDQTINYESFPWEIVRGAQGKMGNIGIDVQGYRNPA